MLSVLMIGDSQVGKTTFMGSMYGVMSRKSGFCIRATEESERSSLKALAKQVRSGGYPSSTQSRSAYDFDLIYEDSYTLDTIMSFRWIDYRGGALHMRQNEIVADLEQYLHSSGAFLIFLDSMRLENPDSEMQRQWRLLKSIMLRISESSSSDRPIALSIILTKCDLFMAQRGITDEFESLRAALATDIGVKLAEFLEQLNTCRYLHGMLAACGINGQRNGRPLYPFLHSMYPGFLCEFNERVKDGNDRFTAGTISMEDWDEHKKINALLREYLSDMQYKLQANDQKRNYFLF